MSSGRRARRQQRAREFGVRHPLLTLVILCMLLAGVIAACGFQLWYGTYLGRDWVIAALAGMAAAAGINAAVVVGFRGHDPMGRAFWAWVVLTVASVSALRFNFPQDPYDSVQWFFNVLHAALLGYAAVTFTGFVALFVGFFLVSRGRLRRPPARAGPEPRRHPGIPARLRFPGATAATWRAGRLVAGGGAVRWLSLNGDVEVDVTAACKELPLLQAGAQGRQPRTTMLATGSGLVEVDVSPKALVELARIIRHPPHEDPARARLVRNLLTVNAESAAQNAK